MTAIEQLTKWYAREALDNGLLAMHFTPGSEAAQIEEAAEVALAMLRYEPAGDGGSGGIEGWGGLT